MRELVRSYQLYDVVRQRDNNALKGFKLNSQRVNLSEVGKVNPIPAHGRIIAKNEYRNRLTKAYNEVKTKLINKLLDIQFDTK